MTASRTPKDASDFEVRRRPPRRFRRRVFFYLLTLSLATSAISGAAFYGRQTQFIERDRARRARTLLTSLATQAELGAYAHEASLCDLAVRRTFREPDVVLTGIYDRQGRAILERATPGIGSAPPPSAALVARLVSDPEAPPERRRGDGYDDLWAPIVTAARGAPGKLEVVGLARIGLSLTPAREQLTEVLRTGVYLAFGLLLLGAGAALLIAGKISDPILALARGADEIRAGNLDVTIEVRARDEVGLLAESFNRMTERLRETMLALEHLNRDLESEVERRTAEIRRSAEFMALLNAPIDRRRQPRLSGQARPNAQAHDELGHLLEGALASLEAATAAGAIAVLLPVEESLDFELEVVATRGADPAAFGPLPSHDTLRDGAAKVEAGRAVLPLLFRGEPEGAVILLDPPSAAAVELATRAAGQLAIAVSNARAFRTLSHLAHALEERNSVLTRQRDQLTEMNRLKSEFLANVSHELRTPLNAIMGYTELMSEEIYGPITVEQREGLAGVDESAHNLLTLINQILDLSKVESGEMELYVTEVALHDVAQSVAAEAHGLTKDRPYEVAVRSPARVSIRTDRARVQQILTNLVGNAIKFTDQGSVTIEVSPRPGGGGRLAVRDTGIGIRKEDQALIFDEFRQVDGSSTRKFQGTGLGLAISRRFARLLCGTLTVQSEPGRGSTFTLDLPPEPRAVARRPAPPPAPSEPMKKVLR